MSVIFIVRRLLRVHSSQCHNAFVLMTVVDTLRILLYSQGDGAEMPSKAISTVPRDSN